jgi:hypothetical protein
MKGVFRKVDDKTLEASGLEAMEALAAVHRGANCIADVRGARNVEQFNLYWTLVDLVAKATDCTKTAVNHWLLLKTANVEQVFFPDGSMKFVPKSIKWESMEQAKFSEFMTRAIPEISALLGSASTDIIRRFEELLDPEARAHFKKIRRGIA